MPNVLNQIVRFNPEEQYGLFRPSSCRDYLALRLAYKLADASAARHYAQLMDRYGEDRLLSAFHRVRDISESHRARSFHLELTREKSTWSNSTRHGQRLAAIRVERRSVAIVIMVGDEVEHVRVRQLSSATDKALLSALAF